MHGSLKAHQTLDTVLDAFFPLVHLVIFGVRAIGHLIGAKHGHRCYGSKQA